MYPGYSNPESGNGYFIRDFFVFLQAKSGSQRLHKSGIICSGPPGADRQFRAPHSDSKEDLK